MKSAFPQSWPVIPPLKSQLCCRLSEKWNRQLCLHALGGDSRLCMSEVSPLNPDWCLRGGGKHTFTRRSVINSCTDRFYMSPSSGGSHLMPQGSGVCARYLKDAISYFRHPNRFVFVASDSLLTVPLELVQGFFAPFSYYFF